MTDVSAFGIAPGDPRTPDVRALLEASQALMLSLYAPEENHALPLEALCRPDVHFLVARSDHRVLGTGALALRDGYGEVKAMFTAPAARGQGVGAALLHAIEAEARQRALPWLRLETGAALAAAVRLYERAGFRRCARFGDYPDDPASLFLEKPLR